MLVTPVSSNDPALASLGLIGVSADPTRDVETASRLVTNTDVAEAVKKTRHLARPEELLTRSPRCRSRRATSSPSPRTETSPEAAANSPTRSPKKRWRPAPTPHEQIEQQLPVLEEQLETAPDRRSAKNRRPARSRSCDCWQAGRDPTCGSRPSLPCRTTQASPRPVLSIAAGIVAGLILGVVAAFAAQVLDPRLRREAQLRRLYRLPILGRIPKEKRTEEQAALAAATSPRSPARPTGPCARPSSTAGSTRRSRVILVTGSAPSEGKTTTAINLATSFALAGKRVILIEADLRRPALGGALERHPPQRRRRQRPDREHQPAAGARPDPALRPQPAAPARRLRGRLDRRALLDPGAPSG